MLHIWVKPPHNKILNLPLIISDTRKGSSKLNLKDQLTWNEISKTNSGHSDKTKVEAVIETPVVLPHLEEASTGRQVHEQKPHRAEGI